MDSKTPKKYYGIFGLVELEKIPFIAIISTVEKEIRFDKAIIFKIGLIKFIPLLKDDKIK